MTDEQFTRILNNVYADLSPEEKKIADAGSAKAGVPLMEHMKALTLRSIERALADTRPIPSMDAILGRAPK